MNVSERSKRLGCWNVRLIELYFDYQYKKSKNVSC